MRFEMRLLCGLAMLLMVPAVGGAASSTPTIQLVVPTIDDPAAGVIGTRAADINNAGNIVFNLDTAAATNSEVGFRPNEGKYKGKFLAPQTYPGAIVSIADQMNNSSTIAGEWEDSTFHFHGHPE